MTVYAQPGTEGSKVTFKDRYENWIGGEWVAPVKGQYFENITPVTGKAFCEVARGTAEDIELALDAAHKIAPSWGKTSVAERAAILNKIADRIDENLELLAVAESWDNGKPIRETLNADIPLAADHFRYFASAVRAQEGRLSQLDDDTTAYHYHEPLGVVGQIIPWNFPILMAVWKLAPALAAGNAVVLKPAEQTPSSILVLMELIGDILPAGVVNVVNGFGVEAGKPLASSPRIRKIAFTGETTTGRLISQYASQNLIPVTLELGGKSPNIFFNDVAENNDAFYDKAQEGFALFAFNQGEVCTCPSRALVQEDIYDSFMADAVARVEKMIQGNPLDTETQVGAQASNDQLEKILSYIDIGKQEGAKVLTGGGRAELPGDLAGGYYVQPTVFEGHNKMRVLGKIDVGSLSFLSPLFLLGGLAVAVPLVLHLLRREAAPRLPFSTLRFLKPEPIEQIRRKRIRELLLLAVRIAALLLLAFAFARPYSARWGGGGRGPTDGCRHRHLVQHVRSGPDERGATSDQRSHRIGPGRTLGCRHDVRRYGIDPRRALQSTRNGVAGRRRGQAIFWQHELSGGHRTGRVSDRQPGRSPGAGDRSRGQWLERPCRGGDARARRGGCPRRRPDREQSERARPPARWRQRGRERRQFGLAAGRYDRDAPGGRPARCAVPAGGGTSRYQ